MTMWHVQKTGLAHFTYGIARVAACAIENGMLVAIGSAIRDSREIVLCDSRYKSEKNRPSQSLSDSETK